MIFSRWTFGIRYAPFRLFKLLLAASMVNLRANRSRHSINLEWKFLLSHIVTHFLSIYEYLHAISLHYLNLLSHPLYVFIIITILSIRNYRENRRIEIMIILVYNEQEE